MWSLRNYLASLTHQLSPLLEWETYFFFFLFFVSGTLELSLEGHTRSLYPQGSRICKFCQGSGIPSKIPVPSLPDSQLLLPFAVPVKGSLPWGQRAIVACGRGEMPPPPHTHTFVFWFMRSRPRRFCSLRWLPVQSRHHRDILISSALVISELLFLSGNI